MTRFQIRLKNMLHSGDACWEYDFPDHYRQLAQKAVMGVEPLTQNDIEDIFPEDEGWSNDGTGWKKAFVTNTEDEDNEDDELDKYLAYLANADPEES